MQYVSWIGATTNSVDASLWYYTAHAYVYCMCICTLYVPHCLPATYTGTFIGGVA